MCVCIYIKYLAPWSIWDPKFGPRKLLPICCCQVPGNGWAQIVAFAGYYELFVYKYSGTPGAGDVVSLGRWYPTVGWFILWYFVK